VPNAIRLAKIYFSSNKVNLNEIKNIVYTIPSSFKSPPIIAYANKNFGLGVFASQSFELKA